MTVKVKLEMKITIIFVSENEKPGLKGPKLRPSNF